MGLYENGSSKILRGLNQSLIFHCTVPFGKNFIIFDKCSKFSMKQPACSMWKGDTVQFLILIKIFLGMTYSHFLRLQLTGTQSWAKLIL
jgi:hypothetical protein